MTKLAKLYDRLEALKDKEESLLESIREEESRLASKVEVVKNGNFGTITLTMGSKVLKTKKNRYGGYDVFTPAKKRVADDLRCSLHDLKIQMAAGAFDEA